MPWKKLSPAQERLMEYLAKAPLEIKAKVVGRSVMTDAERKLLLALAEHIQDWLSDQNVQGCLDAEIREIRELAKIVIGTG